MTEKKVEVVQVKIKTIDESEFKFEQILLNPDFHNVDIKIGGSHRSLVYVQDHENYCVGLIQSTKMDSTPPKRNILTNETLALGLKREEGLLYGNVFLFDKEKQVLLYEVTRDGLFIGQLGDLFYSLIRDYPLVKIDIKFIPLMNANAMEKLLSMGDRKAVHIQFAHPDEMLKKIKSEQSAIKEIIKPGKDIGAELIDVIYKVTTTKGKYLHNGKINNMLEYINNKFDLLRDNVKKFEVKGYEEDVEKITEVDFIRDKMIEKIKYSDSKNMSDLKPTARKQEIILAYERLRRDIYRYL
ncbi:hypothetical protein [Pedobacter zeae]|uniref:Uncharacterized protein n=1 Tax=Pedobacter zeae TaxID=1737356 RepID=A0A7W6KD15_9SPHI|nr:hypothetical protein [Pedobacter zeae]MBB4108470.1 hypothetical protein [Pedobacter zeae]GGG92587.1 hypothetical protein GCM10007422_02090 [Pedobacter zeae]